MRRTCCQRRSYWRPLCERLPRLSVCGHPRVPVGQTQQDKRTQRSSEASAQLPGGAAIAA